MAGDFNEDGIMDLAVTAEEFGDHIAVLRGLGTGGVGDGTFASPVLHQVGNTPRSLVAEDFNDDGILDIAVTTSGGVGILIGGGTGGVANGSFSLAGSYAAGTNPQGVAAGDFNEDGILDLAVAAGVDDAVSVLIGNGSSGVGDGTFGTHKSHNVGDSPVQLLVGDFLEDGILDIAVVNNGGVSNSVSILVGQGASGMGNGGFAAGTTAGVGANPWGICKGDFNDDQIEDLAVANPNSNSVSILTGNGSLGVGDGTFAVSNYGAGTAPMHVAAGDFNVDGFTDLIVTNRTQDRMSILFNDWLSVGSFIFGVDYLVGDEPKGLVVNDFLEDQFPDVISVNNTGGNVSLLTGGCNGLPATTVSVVTANGGEQWQIGTEELVFWSTGAGVMSVDVELSRDDGLNWEPLRRGEVGNTFMWTVTEPPTTTALIRVFDPTAPGRTDTSDTRFEIVSAASAVENGNVPALAYLSHARPNPSSSAVFLELVTPTAVEASIVVYDVAGRRVATLFEGTLPSGNQVLRWNGLMTGGRRAPSGVYFIRASWNGFNERRKVVLIR